MSTGFEFLTIYSEICLGTTAFFAIVATLRQTLGESLTEYQYLITRFFYRYWTATNTGFHYRIGYLFH
jgi:hypothetical protein